MGDYGRSLPNSPRVVGNAWGSLANSLGVSEFSSPAMEHFSASVRAPSLESTSPTPRTVMQDGPETARRAAEWERQIESLDQKEMEIHQTQLRLIREQTATFRGDLLALRQEVLDLKAMVSLRESAHADLSSMVEAKMRDFREFVDRDKKELRTVLERELEERAAALSRLERRCNELGEGVSKHASLHQEGRARLDQLHGRVDQQHSHFSQQHATLPERVAYCEKVLGDSADKHAQALRDSQLRLDQLHGRLAACEAGHGELKKAHTNFASDKVGADAKHASVADRLSYLEKVIGDSADKHGRELETFKAYHSKHVNDTKVTHSNLHSILLSEKEAREQHHASVAQRLNYLESQLGESADKHAKEVELLKGSHARLLGDTKAQKGHHSSVAERLQYVEKLLGDSADKHTQELAAAHAKLEHFHGRIAHCETHSGLLEVLKKACNSFQKDKAEYDSHHASVRERVEYLERAVGDSADKHAKELDEMKAAHAKLATQSQSHAKNHSSMVDRFELLAREKDSLHSHHATIEERINFLEKSLGDSADKHAKELNVFKAAHTKLQTETLARDQHHASVEERLKYIESVIGDSADKHAQELQVAHSKLDQLHGKLAEERKARELHHGATKDLLSSHREKQDAHHATMEERLVFLEKAIGDSANKHLKELEAMKASHSKLAGDAQKHQARHASVEERLDYIEGWFRSFKPR